MSSLVAIGSLLAAVPAQALSFTWQFIPESGPTGANPYVVKGTIDGLAIGANSGAGITATVTDTPTGELLGSYAFDFSGSGNAFTVDGGGNVTFADAGFISSNNLLFFGGYGVFIPQLVDGNDGNPSWIAFSGQTTFSSSTAVPFDFSPAPAVVILGSIFAAKKLRNKLVKK